jgi:hypothetical protein
MKINNIPPYLEPQVCAEETCLNTATKTVCAEGRGGDATSWNAARRTRQRKWPKQ